MIQALWQLFSVFLQIGAFSIGGGYAVIPMIRDQVVIHQGWMTQKVFTDMITISQMTPGPLAINTSTFAGLQIAGIPGAVAATLGCIIPGVAAALLLHLFFRKHQTSAYISGVLEGLKAASVGLIMSAGGTILLLTFCGTFDWRAVAEADLPSIFLFGAALFILRKWNMNPILLMVLTGTAGYIVYGVF